MLRGTVAAQEFSHRGGMVFAIGQHGDFRYTLLHGGSQRLHRPAVQADHAGIVPGLLEASEGQLHRCHLR